ncbi:MAG TPA: Na+/H+ antiporter [Puia sp.]|jgi:CPA1 family monovalent cation:H+ antiporter|nr:Na+/H+ antiporter [Puia sp.]
MLQDNLLLVISLLFAVTMLSMLSDKLRISYPIFLVIAGLLISLFPGVPRIMVDPDIVFVIFLPPLLYAAAWNTSWQDFWRSRRPIGMLAFGLVIITACAVAYVTTRMIPGFSWALGFLLGGIISPPDAVAATSVLQTLKVPKRVVTVLEGESLINDASSLIVFRFAMVTMMTGQFVLWKAGVDFLEVSIFGVAIGVLIGFGIYAIHRWLPTTPSIDTGISLISPYLMYITAEHFHFSGVLAVVSGGLFVSYRSHDALTYSSRLQSQSVWNVLIFLLNGVVFILIGLQLPSIVRGLGEYSLGSAIVYGLVISLVAVIVRLLWVFPGAYLPRLCFKKIRMREARPEEKQVFILGWSGMRGIVSLASALAIPYMLSKDVPFPHRNLILFITFVVILCTLVLQGLSLPLLVRRLKLEVQENEEEQQLSIRLRLANAVLDHITGEYGEESSTIDAFNRLKERYERMVQITSKRLEKEEGKDISPDFLPRYRQLLIELVAVQRRELSQMRHDNLFSDELLRSKEFELDLEEARFRRVGKKATSTQV